MQIKEITTYDESTILKLYDCMKMQREDHANA